MADAFTRSFPWESTFISQMERRRNAEGWTQTDLARKLKVRGLPFHQQTIQRIEKGERAVRLDEAFVIAELFDVSLDAMMTHYEGPMEDAATAIDRVRRYASSLTENAQDEYLEFLNEFDQLALSFDDLLNASEHKATPELAWLAAWAVKCGWVIDSWLEVERFSAGLHVKSGDWHSILGTLSTSWDELRWVMEEGAGTLWEALPEKDRPLFLADMNPADLQAWITERTNGEHSEAP